MLVVTEVVILDDGYASKWEVLVKAKSKSKAVEFVKGFSFADEMPGEMSFVEWYEEDDLLWDTVDYQVRPATSLQMLMVSHYF